MPEVKSQIEEVKPVRIHGDLALGGLRFDFFNLTFYF
jgi:hypothetical protein